MGYMKKTRKTLDQKIIEKDLYYTYHALPETKEARKTRAKKMLSALFAVIAIDYFTGFAASFFETEKSKGPSSARGMKGIVKKAFMIALVMLAHQVDVVAGGGNLARTMTICFFFGNEGLSILENTARMGLPVPSALKNKLAQLAEEKTEVRQ